MNKFVLRQSLLLLLTATIWGVAFVAQSVGMEYVGPFTFNAVRCIIGGIVLLPCIAFLDYLEKKKTAKSQKTSGNQKTSVNQTAISSQSAVHSKIQRRIQWIGGIVCGIILCIASNLQQIGIQYTTVGKAGFVTAMYIVIVPILGIFVKKKAGIKVWVGVVVAVIGLYLLCMKESFSFEKGDVLVLLCALTFSFHIIVVDKISPLVNGVKVSCIQFFTCGVLSAVPMFLYESPKTEQILTAWLPILYAGILSCGVAYTLQIVGQKGMNPTAASLIMSLESVISVLAGWILLGEKLSFREITGCVLMFAAIVLVQIPTKKKRQIDDSIKCEYN